MCSTHPKLGLKPSHMTALRRAACKDTPLGEYVETMHTLARHRVLPPSLYAAPILQRLEAEMQTMCTSSLYHTAHVLHACARLRLTAHGRALIDHCEAMPISVITQQAHSKRRVEALTSILWACAVLGHRPGPALVDNIHAALLRPSTHPIASHHASLCQLWAAETYATRMQWWDDVELSQSIADADTELWDAACAAWASTLTSSSISAMQRDVHLQLQRLVDGSGHYEGAPWLQQGWDVTLEGRVGAWCRTDVLLHKAPHKIAIEADGPLHFTRNQDEAAGHPRALGNTWLRDALLASHDGCVVVQVPWWEWEALPDAVSKQAWLARACRDVLDDLLLLTPDN